MMISRVNYWLLLHIFAVYHCTRAQQSNESGSTSPIAGCIREYYDLERSLLSSTANIDSLTQSWFPPNEQSVQVVEVFYYINDSSIIEHPIVLELGGLNKTELEQGADYDYRYRWSLTPIYLFMDHEVLEALSLHVVRILRHEARLVVDPICEEYSVRGIRLPEFYLNQMTSLLKSYATMRSDSLTEGLVEDSQGYASYYNSTRNDFIVLEFDEDYQGNMFLLAFSLVALAIFVTIAVPLLIYAHYKTLYNLAQDEDSNFVFLVWGTISVAVIIVFLVLVIDIVFVVKQLEDGPPSVWQYILTLVLVGILAVIDLFFALILPKESDFPVPRLLKVLFCQGRKGCPRSTVVPQVVGIWFLIMFMQLATFHASFMFLAFIARPVEAGSTALLYVAAVFCGVSLVTLFFAVFQKGRNESHQKTLRYAFQRIIYFILFVCILAFVILFSTCFLRVTIYVGDFESGGIPALFASLAPSILLGALGFVARTVLKKYDLKKGKEGGFNTFKDTGEVRDISVTPISDGDSEALAESVALGVKSQGARKRPKAATAIEMQDPNVT